MFIRKSFQASQKNTLSTLLTSASKKSSISPRYFHTCLFQRADNNNESDESSSNVAPPKQEKKRFSISEISQKPAAELRNDLEFLLNVKEQPEILEDPDLMSKYKSLEEQITRMYERAERPGDVERSVDPETGHRIEKVKVPEYMHKFLGQSYDDQMDAAQDDLEAFFNHPRFTHPNPGPEILEQWEENEYLDSLYFTRVSTSPALQVTEEMKQQQEEIQRYEDQKLIEDFMREKNKDKASDEYAVLKFDHLQDIFYERVGIEETEDGLFVIKCGTNRLLASQFGNVVQIPSRELALAVAAEWEMQDLEIRGNLMPITDLVTRAQDAQDEREARKGMRKKMRELYELDELIHREGVDEFLKSRMRAVWDPIIEWFNEYYNIKLQVYEEGFQMGNEDEVMRAVNDKEVMENWTALEIVTLMQLCSVTDSVTVSLAIMHGALSFDHAFHAANLPKIEQTDTHGIAEGDVDVTFQDRRYKLAAYYYWAQLLREWKQEKLAQGEQQLEAQEEQEKKRLEQDKLFEEML